LIKLRARELRRPAKDGARLRGNTMDVMMPFNRLPLAPVRALAGFLVLLVLTLPAMAGPSLKTNGCSTAQVQSASAVACLKKLESDVFAGYSNVHELRCDSSGIQCCIKLGSGGWGGCEAALVAPRSSSGISDRSPPMPDPVCAELKTISGIWTADSNSIKPNADKKSCSQTFKCAPPPSDKLSADQKKCTAVVSVSNKQVTQNGTCVPGSSSGTCSSCLAKPPNDPCSISFRR
jgi:hypothetical protein